MSSQPHEVTEQWLKEQREVLRGLGVSDETAMRFLGAHASISMIHAELKANTEAYRERHLQLVRQAGKLADELTAAAEDVKREREAAQLVKHPLKHATHSV